MNNVKIVMVANDRAAPEGHTVVDYAEGEQHTVPKWLADHFLEHKTAEVVGDKPNKPNKPNKE